MHGCLESKGWHETLLLVLCLHVQAYAVCTAGYLFQNQAEPVRSLSSPDGLVMLFGMPQVAARAAFGGGIWKKCRIDEQGEVW